MIRPYTPALRTVRSGLARLLLVVALLALPPVAALGAEGSIPLSGYQEQLRQGLHRLEEAEALFRAGEGALAEQAIAAAQEQLSGRWVVESPHGPVSADLTGLDELLEQAKEQPEQHLGAALGQAREHLAAAEALQEVEPAQVPEVRESLERALRRMEAKSIIERMRDWFLQLLGRPVERAAATGAKLPQAVGYAASAVAAAALVWLLFRTMRLLSTQAAGGEATLRTGRSGPPERPPTPSELRMRAQALGRGGEHLEGLRTAHLALLLHLDALGLIRYQPAQTNREHERQLRRRQPQLALRLRSLNDLVDDRLYSGHEATRADFDAVESLVDQLWREGEAVSRSAEATPGRSSSASLS